MSDLYALTCSVRNQLVARLIGRAQHAAGNARAVHASGYRAEALLHEAKSEAYRQAAADVEELLGAEVRR